MWIDRFRADGVDCHPFDALRGKKADALRVIHQSVGEMAERYMARGIRRTIRALVVGVPNVGKSAFINRLCGRSAAKTSDRPGVTRAPQWVAVSETLDLLDTPGMMWPRIDDPDAARRLAYLGTIRDSILDTETLAESLLVDLMRVSSHSARDRFHISGDAIEGQNNLLEAACAGRGFLLPGGRFDTARGAAIVLDEFRAGKLGRITLEWPA